MLDLLLTGRQLGHAAAVDDVDILGTQTLGAAGSVHGDIAAADNGNGLALHDGRAGILLVRLHQVDAGQVLVGGVDAVQALAGDAHKAGQTGTGRDIDGLEAVVVHQLVDGQDFTDDHVRLDVHAQLLQALDLVLDDVLGQTELGDAVHQHAAGHMQGLVDGDLVAQLGQIARDGQAGRACADDSDLVAVGRGGGGLGMYVVAVPVGNKALETANADGLSLDAADALAFALVLLRADTAADGGQRAGLGNHVVGGLKVALGDVLDEAGNINFNGAAAAAGVVLALQAALGLVHGHLLGVAKGDLFKVFVADVRLLAGHGALFRIHVRHNYCTSCFSKLHSASRACASKGLYIVPRCIASSKSTSKPSKSGPSTQANLV